VSRCDEAIAAGEADHAFAKLARFQYLVLAVSGGPDSLALLYLITEWRKRLGERAPNVRVATVDHGLREESAREAEIVAEHCAALGLPHTTLRWEGAKPARGIPNAARNARYALLDAHARTFSDTSAVITAHHQDDQAETVFMRLARGGGVDALAAMRNERAISKGSPVRLVRPLLGFSKAQLIATLSVRGVSWLDDPANSNMTFERARVRQTLEASGLEAAALAATARRMQDAGEGLAYAVTHFKETLTLTYNRGIFAQFDRRAFDAGPSVLRQTIIADLISRFGGSTPKPEAAEIEALTLRISSAKESTMATLGGTQISVGLSSVRLWRELGRIAAADAGLLAGKRLLWDDRFWVNYEGDAGGEVTVKLLGLEGYGTIADVIEDDLRVPVAAALGLPSFWVDATLLAVPQLGVVTKAGLSRRGLSLASEPVDF
jgi:tRNA(Ile)-lysidine synthase